MNTYTYLFMRICVCIHMTLYVYIYIHMLYAGAQELQNIQPIVEIIAVLEDHKKSLCEFNQRAKGMYI
jgi:hypothetical protein